MKSTCGVQAVSLETNPLRDCRNSTYHAPATKIWLFICSRPKGLVSTRLFAFGDGRDRVKGSRSRGRLLWGAN